MSQPTCWLTWWFRFRGKNCKWHGRCAQIYHAPNRERDNQTNGVGKHRIGLAHAANASEWPKRCGDLAYGKIKRSSARAVRQHV